MTNALRARRALGILAACALLLPSLACGFLRDEEQDQPAAVTVPAVEPAPAPEPAAAGGGACSRVAACCRAYVETMGGSVPANTCDAYSNTANLPESMCESTLSGYRSGLTAMNKAVPGDCAE